MFNKTLLCSLETGLDFLKSVFLNAGSHYGCKIALFSDRLFAGLSTAV